MSFVAALLNSLIHLLALKFNKIMTCKRIKAIEKVTFDNVMKTLMYFWRLC